VFKGLMEPQNIEEAITPFGKKGQIGRR